MTIKKRDNKLFLNILILCIALTFMVFGAYNAHAINAVGNVHCDANNDGIMSVNDMLIEGIVVEVTSTTISYSNSATTNATGFYSIPLLSSPQTYIETLNAASIPNGAAILYPAGGQYILNVTDPTRNAGPYYWLLSNAACKTPFCGDGILDPGEQCDDGNGISGDGCRSDCTIESCGDSILDPQEQCDDGNRVDGDGCSANCTIEPQCGNGILEAGEQCDDGNNVTGDGCSPSCKYEICGNGILDPNEQCDDGNTVPGDGCSAICIIEFCGDGILQTGLSEQCDDGNTVNGDGCSANCTLERMEGCTPGYWKQPQHFDSWALPYTPGTLFSSVFEDAFPGKTLLQVMETGGGGLYALGRHTVAALLNSASLNVNYNLGISEVITSFNNVYPGTKDAYNGVKDSLEIYNQQGCPLN